MSGGGRKDIEERLGAEKERRPFDMQHSVWRMSKATSREGKKEAECRNCFQEASGIKMMSVLF